MFFVFRMIEFSGGEGFNFHSEMLGANFFVEEFPVNVRWWEMSVEFVPGNILG